jgi:hypothetical protein
MRRRSRASALSLLPCVLLLTACGSSFQAVEPMIDASLLQPCVDPILAPENPSDNELAAEPALRQGLSRLQGAACGACRSGERAVRNASPTGSVAALLVFLVVLALFTFA